MMIKQSLLALAVLAAASQQSFADGADDAMLERNRTIESMKFQNEKLQLQASMAKAFKDMAEAGFIVDSDGTPMGVGDMEILAMEVRRRGGKGGSDTSFNPNDPFAGASSVIPMPAVDGMFTRDGFQAAPSMRGAEMPSLQPEGSAEVITKPTEKEKAEGKQMLALTEVRGDSAVLFTNNGFEEVRRGGKVYDMRLTEIGIDNVLLTGPDGDRIVRIDWTKSVRYSDD